MASGFLVFNLRGFLNTSLLSVECGLSLKRVRPFRICFAATPPVGSRFFWVFFMVFCGIFYGFLAFDCKKPVRITRIGLT